MFHLNSGAVFFKCDFVLEGNASPSWPQSPPHPTVLYQAAPHIDAICLAPEAFEFASYMFICLL